MDADRIKSWATVGVVLVLIVAVVLGLRYTLAPRHLPQGGIPPPNGLPSNVMLRMQKPEFIGYDGQQKAWVLRAKRVDLSSDRTRIEAHGDVEAELFDTKTGKRRALVTAPFAVFSKQTKMLQVGGKLVCRTPGTGSAADLAVEAETLLWNVGAKQVVCPGRIVATLPDRRGTASGQDLTLDLPTREWTVKKFHGRFALPANQGIAPPAFTLPFKTLR